MHGTCTHMRVHKHTKYTRTSIHSCVVPVCLFACSSIYALSSLFVMLILQVPSDVDLRVMLTFLEVYAALLGFVNYQLYNSINLRYPPLVCVLTVLEVVSIYNCVWGYIMGYHILGHSVPESISSRTECLTACSMAISNFYYILTHIYIIKISIDIKFCSRITRVYY